MAISLRPDPLKRYRDLARQLLKYGRSDLVTRAGPDEALGSEGVPAREAARRVRDARDQGVPGETARPALIVASGGGVWLAINILRSDRDRRTR